jgi:CheY-like chemotaxis protein
MAPPVKKPPAVVLVLAEPEATRAQHVETLQQAGFETRVALDAASAIASAAETPPSAILMDLPLPRPKEWESLAAIQADPKTMHVPLVALASLGKSADTKSQSDVRLDRVLVKPCLALELARTLREVLAVELARSER